MGLICTNYGAWNTKNPFLLLIAISSWKPGQSDWSF